MGLYGVPIDRLRRSRGACCGAAKSLALPAHRMRSITAAPAAHHRRMAPPWSRGGQGPGTPPGRLVASPQAHGPRRRAPRPVAVHQVPHRGPPVRAVPGLPQRACKHRHQPQKPLETGRQRPKPLKNGRETSKNGPFPSSAPRFRSTRRISGNLKALPIMMACRQALLASRLQTSQALRGLRTSPK